MFNFQVRMLATMAKTKEKSERLVTVKADKSSNAIKFAKTKVESMVGVGKASPMSCEKLKF